MKRALVLGSSLLLFVGCRAKSPQAAATPSPSPSATKVLSAVQLTPYDAPSAQKAVQQVIDANAQHNQDIQGLADPKD